MQINKKTRGFTYFILIGLSLMFILVLPLGHDLHYHLYRIGAMAEELVRTNFRFPIRVLSDTYNEYGYGVPLFYGDVLLYIPALLVLAGVPIKMVFKLLLVAIFWMTFITMKYEISKISKNKDLAFITASLWVLSPYFIQDLCIRMAIGEASAFIFIPFVFGGAYQLLNSDDKNAWLDLSLGMVGVLLCHNLTFVFSFVILLIWFLIEIKKVIEKKIVGKLCMAAGVAILLSASFLFPMLEAMMYAKYQTPGNNDYQMMAYISHSLDPIDFLFPSELLKILNSILGTNFDMDNWKAGAVGLLWLITLIFDIANRKEKKNKTLQVFFYINTVVYFCQYKGPIVDVLSRYFGFMQFGWRILTFSTFSFVVYLAYLIWKFPRKYVKKTYILLAAMYVMFVIGARYAYQVMLDIRGMDYIESINPEFAEHYNMSYNPNEADNIYLLEGVSESTYLDRGDVVTSNHEDVSIAHSLEGNKLYIDVTENPYNDLEIEVPKYMYKGYSAVNADNGQSFDIVPSKNGLALIQLKDASDAKILVTYTGTLIQKISDIITALTLIGLIAYGVTVISKNKRKA